MKPAFTLIELLIVIAILGILAAAVLVAINPGKRTAQARDAQRKQDINAIANALIGYYTLVGEYPREMNCDTSRGYINPGGPNYNCAESSGTGGWEATSPFYQALVEVQAFLKKIPTDPNNVLTYYYKYEPTGSVGATPGSCPVSATTNPCTHYWIGSAGSLRCTWLCEVNL